MAEKSTELIVHIPVKEGYGERPSLDANLPADVRYDPNLSPTAKLMYCEIRALSFKHGFCFAKNKYFEKAFGLDERQIRRILQQLKENGYIAIYKARNDEDGKIYRIIQVAGSKLKTENRTKMSAKTGQKCPQKPDKNVRHENNKNNINNINLNKINDSTQKSKNKFKNFPERQYTDEQLSALEEALLKPRIGAGDSS